MGADNQVISPETRAYVRYLRDRDRLNYRRIAQIVGISKSAVWRICVKPNNPREVHGTRLRSRGRPSKIGPRLRRIIIREMLRLRATRGNFTVRHIMTNLKLNSMGISDLNPIENVFKLLGDQLRDNALDQNIEREKFREFRRRVVKTLLGIPADVIDRIIASMPKRIDSIIEARGGRLKY